MTQIDTKTRILDAAEQLFARDGFHMTSLRTLTERAGVNLAAVNYHFNSKEGLLQSVIERRLIPLNKERAEKINAVLAAANQAEHAPSTRDLMYAFIRPTLIFQHSSPGAGDFIALVGRSLSEPDETVRTYFTRQIMPTFRLLLSGLELSCPSLPTETLRARIQFALGALGHVMCQSSLPRRQQLGLPPTLSAEQTVEELVTFITAGLEAPC